MQNLIATTSSAILRNNSINTERLAQVLGCMDLETASRLSLFITDNIHMPELKQAVQYGDKKCLLSQVNVLENTVHYKACYTTTRWFRTAEDAEKWQTSENPYYESGCRSKSDSYPYSATAEVECSDSMSIEKWAELGEVGE